MTTLPGLAGGTRLRVTLFGCRAHPLSLSTHYRCHAPRSDREKNRAWVKTIGSFISCLRGPCVVSGLQSLMATWYQDDGDSNARREARPAAQWSQVGDPFLSLSSHLIVTCWILSSSLHGLVSLLSFWWPGRGRRHQPVPVTPLCPL